MNRDVVRALDFARKAHGDQKYGDQPYMYHVEQVVSTAAQFGGSVTEQIVAALHDVLEDTEVTGLQIAKEFGPDIANLVTLLSNVYQEEKISNGDLHVRVNKALTYEYIRTDPRAVFVKLCDRYCNVREGKLNKKYRKEMPLFVEKLYRAGEYDLLWDRIRHFLGMGFPE
jgi:(p)ppGpp synthase/HD superfamily hydrolase